MNFANYGSKVYLSRAQTKAMSLDAPIGDPFGGPAYGERNDPVTATIGGSAAAGLIGGAMGANAAENAAHMQSEASAAATAEQRRQYDITRSDMAPWMGAGSDAIGRIRALLGLGADTGGDFGSLNRRFTIGDFNADPVNQLGLQFGLDEGSKSIRRMFGANGMGRSGAASKALTRFGTDYAGSKAAESRARFLQDQDVTFNRLSGVAGTGQTATTNVSGMGSNMATNIGNNLTGAANARGAAAIAGANSYAAPIGQIGGALQTKYLLDSMRPPAPAPQSRFMLYGDD